jgi:hypothetical protein
VSIFIHMRLSHIVREILEGVEYRGTHEAPDKENGAPLHKLDQIYPADIYSSNAVRYYGSYNTEVSDNESISIMQSVREKPNAQVKIYRAVPKIKTPQEKIYDLEKQKAHIMKHGKVPSNVNTPLNSSQYYTQISNDIKKLKSLPPQDEEKIKINPGDWVTINKKYAILHGESSLNGEYKIISKEVPAKHLYTDANSIHEFGYDPS